MSTVSTTRVSGWGLHFKNEADPFVTSLELKLQSKLHLSGRSRISGGETRVTNDTEGRTANLRSAPGLTEVRMIEEVKNLPTKFDYFALT